MDVNEELKFLGKFKKKIWGVRGGRVGGGLDGCERRIVFFGGKIQKKIGGGRGGRGEELGWGGFWVDVNEELKFWGKFTKKKSGGVGSGGGQIGGVGLVGGSGWM